MARKSIVVLAAAVLSLGLVACKGGDNATTSAVASPSGTTSAVASTPANTTDNASANGSAADNTSANGSVPASK